MAYVAIASVMLACGQNEPEQNIPENFPRKQLIEHFTSQSCGYCPDGIAYIEQGIAGNSNYVWVSHHAGFADDIYTIKGSKTITSTFKIRSAPNIMLNRDDITTEEGSGKPFHPYYLASVASTQAQTALASVVISRSYDSATRELKVKVSGQSADATAEGYRVTILVKESGMVAPQLDYSHTFEGWEEFVHTNAVRTFLTEPMGDVAMLSKHEYSIERSCTLSSEWMAENCMVVAYITGPANYPIVNAEECPVVEGTKGGADIEGGGKKVVPVSDTYPEEGTAIADVTYEMAQYGVVDKVGNSNLFELMLAAPSTLTDNNSYFPLADFLIVADADTLPYGTYNLVDVENLTAGTAIQGFRYESETEAYIDGSILYYIDAAYYKQTGSMYYEKRYLLREGSVVVSEDGISFSATTLNGSHTAGTFSGKAAKASAPKRSLISRK